MTDIPLIALRTLRYHGKKVLAGESFSVSTARSARLLKKIRKAKDPDPLPTPPPQPAPRTYRTAVLEPEKAVAPRPEPPLETEPTSAPDVPEESTEDAQPKKRTYKRRDLTAESAE